MRVLFIDNLGSVSLTFFERKEQRGVKYLGMSGRTMLNFSLFVARWEKIRPLK